LDHQATTIPRQPSSSSVAAKEAWKWSAGGGGGKQEDEKEENAVELPSCLPPLSILASSPSYHCKAYVQRLTHLYYTHVHIPRTMKPVCLLSLLVAGAAAFHMRK